MLFRSYKTTTLFAYPAAAGDITISDGVKTIGEKAFYGCTSLNSVDLSNVTKIGASSFRNCTSIEQQAFYNCANLTIVGNDLSKCSEIDRYAFCNCNSLEEIVLSGLIGAKSSSDISSYAFCDCENLKTVTYKCTD